MLGGTMLLISGSLTAQVRPLPGIGDPHIQSIDYRADQVVEIDSSPGYQVSIELAADEQIQSVVLGDSAGWQVTANKAGNHLFVKPLQAGVETNMTVVTNVRTYAFNLGPFAGLSASMPYTVRFNYPRAASPFQPRPVQPVIPKGRVIRYVIGGERPLRPSTIRDDGIHTYINWPASVDLPAVYVIDQEGRESLADGNMRGGVYVLDTVADHLVFRIDKLVATADRRLVKVKHR
ncbi:TrbG/VirB9 family P-type conjugative transfer protein [uncultured Sphingomonas sp.]|uniref:TrbG/VirB9 family P-type conjugative transfer protein n=1 Tax=uncultured Sphingomonas sp. TaxID=158754 RepID=UPI0015765C61